MNKVILLLFLLCNAGFYVSAQEKITFPVKGIYKVSDDSEKVNRDYNFVEIKETVFYLLWNKDISRSFEIIGKNGNEYTVQRFFFDDNPREGGKEQFNVKIDSMNDNECYLTVLVAGRTEKIHLVKTK